MPTFNLNNATLVNLRKKTTESAGKPLPRKWPYAVTRNAVELERHLKAYDQLSHAALQDCVLRDDDGKPVAGDPTADGRPTYKIDPDKIREFGERMGDLDMAVQENVTIHFAPWATAEDYEGKPEDLMALAWMVDELSTLKSVEAEDDTELEGHAE